MWIHRMTSAQVAQVLALADRAASADGVDPLNEEARLSLYRSTARHLLASRQGKLQAYLNYHPTFATAQLVVDPQHRRSGLGSRLWRELPTPVGTWAFGDTPASRGFATAMGMHADRRLMMFTRPLAGAPTPHLPDDLRLRSYTPADAKELLAVNAAAFAAHPEQGHLDAAGLADRMAERWFDPAGLLLGFDAEGLAGFHWTKVVDGVGEVYVMAVAPRAQGRGYGKALLDAGISHLAAKGLPTVSLFVDAADQIAVRMYERAGFGLARVDVYYAPGDEEQ
ncbi:MAG: mycothiol synthase [Propionibacteriales bacterium]|nr:mycothiol synthase [Propionibacteriales bacterium]